MRAPGAATSLERVEWIIALDDDAVRRNLLITQCYHDLSAGLAELLGAENVNWCTFATWASRTAGSFIRNEEIPSEFRLLLGKAAPIHVRLARANAALAEVDADTSVRHDSLLDIVRDVVADVARLVAAGNLAVFGELGPLFSRTIDALAARSDADALAALAGTLTSGMSERGGQSLLRSALVHYAAARLDPDPRRKAQRMLVANGQVGLHEQIRLQPFIAGAIDAPIRDALAELLEETGETLPEHLRTEAHAIMSRMLHPVADGAERLWQEFATRELMTLRLPEGTLVLGRDLPAPPGAPPYPAVLAPIDAPDAIGLLDEYGADRPDMRGTAATDWARLSDRMRYILDFFRSRQCDGSLLEEPFTAAVRGAILAGRTLRKHRGGLA